MVKHNNLLANEHFKKQWQRRVKTWLDQPAKKKSRRVHRQLKAVREYPRPVSGLLRPIVRCPTNKYKTKLRFGRGFTLEEIREAKINPLEARGIGISIDYRRKNGSKDDFMVNVQRLLLYKSKLVLFPRKTYNKKGEKNPVPTDEQVKQNFTCDIVPFHGKQKRIRARVITKEEHGSSAYLTLRKEQAKARKVGLPLRKKREETKKQDQQPSLSKKERKKVEKGQDKEE